MRYKTLGKTGLTVSEMCLGTWGIGGVGWDDRPVEERHEAIRAAVENGITFIDTAPAYNAGVAEQHVGAVLEEMGVRDKIVISTKCGTKFVNGKYYRTCKTEDIAVQIEESLANLRTDYIDVYLIHWPDPNVPFQVTLDFLNKLKAQGKIRHIGVSNFSVPQMEEALQYADIEIYQPQYSMVCLDNEETIRWAHDHNIGVMSYGSLGAGMLTGKYREPVVYPESDNRNRFYKFFSEPGFSDAIKVVETMDEISASRGGVPLSQIAVNWTTQKDFISSAIIGCQSRRNIEQNVSAFDWTLTAEEMAKLDQAVDTYIRR